MAEGDRYIFSGHITVRQMTLLFVSCVALDVTLFGALVLAPAEAWYNVPLALCLGIYNALTIGKLQGWID